MPKLPPRWIGTFWSERYSYCYFWTWVRGEFKLHFNDLTTDFTTPFTIRYTGEYKWNEEISGEFKCKNGQCKAYLPRMKIYFTVNSNEDDVIKGTYMIPKPQDYGTFELKISYPT